MGGAPAPSAPPGYAYEFACKKCLAYNVGVHNSGTQYGTERPIIFTLILQIIVIGQMLSTGGKRYLNFRYLV